MFILAEHRATGEDLVANFRRYRDYLSTNRSRFPPQAYELASSEWYFNPKDRRCPHDGWLESLLMDEPASGERREQRTRLAPHDVAKDNRGKTHGERCEVGYRRK